MLERTIICDGASKTWAMTGWRIGYVANRALAPVFTRWITNTDSCASQISQWAALEAITGPQDAADAMRASFLERRDLIVGLLNEVPGITLQDARRRVLRVAERHRGLPRSPAAPIPKCSASGCCTRRASRCSPTSISGAAFPATASTSAFRTRRRPRRSATASRASTRSSARHRRSTDAHDADLARRTTARRATPCSARVRKALGKTGDRARGARRRRAYIAAHAQGPRPAMPADLVARFMQRATDMAEHASSASPTVATIPAGGRALSRRAGAAAGARRAEIARGRLLAGIRRSRLGGRGARDRSAARPTGDDRLGITGAFCAIAETGTLVVLSGADTPTATTLLPDTHIAVVRADRIVSGMEEAFALIRARAGRRCRARST